MKALIAIAAILILGCTAVTGVQTIDGQRMNTGKYLLKLEAEVKELRLQVKQKENQLKEKDSLIKQLNKKLETFGIFD
ncbi:hypothetical protein ACFL1K_02675 [Candidatus Omnitrophota bacterium]